MSLVVYILPEPLLTLRAKKLPRGSPLFRGRVIVCGAVLDYRHFSKQPLNSFWVPACSCSKVPRLGTVEEELEEPWLSRL